MLRTVIQTDKAPAAIGAYSQAFKVGNTVYLSGQIPLDASTMQLVDGDFKAQVQQVFDNLSAVAKAAGGSLADTVKLNVSLTDLANFKAVSDVMESCFSEPYPARAVVGVAALPEDAPVEIEAILVLPES
ncbi:MAG TPA: RidA family protein [Gammaproteobacteria bacterium]|nr:RidA family protein [Gammaproteobacteria bacterium]